MSGKNFITTKNGSGFGIQPIKRLPKGGDIHDTFQVDGQGNIKSGHTTIRIPGGKNVKLSWSNK